MSNQNLYFFTFNNYQNKLCKGRPNLALAKHIIKASFNPNDGVDATQVVNVSYDLYDCDYMVEEYSQNQYRCWYIVDVTRLSGGQIQINLKRDILTDYIEEVYNMKLVIHRGYVPNDNSAIYNLEGFNFNQIKKGETLLKDDTGVAWIIGYVPLGLNISSIQFATPNVSGIETISSIDNLPYKAIDNNIYVYKNHELNASIRFTALNNTNYMILMSGASNNKAFVPVDYNTNEYLASTGALFPEHVSDEVLESTRQDNETWYQRVYDYTKGNDTHALYDISLIDRENGKIYYSTSDSKYYRVVIEKSSSKTFSKNVTGSSLASYMYNELAEFYTPHIGYSQSKRVGYSKIEMDVYVMYTVEVMSSQTYHIATESFTNDSIKVAKQPYKMFAFPYKKIPRNTIFLHNTSEEIEFAIDNVQNIVDAFLSYWSKDSARLIDLQIVPYCPKQSYLSKYLTYNVVNIPDDLCIDILDGNNNVRSRGFWVDTDSQSFNISNIKEVGNLKQELECDLYRLCSPHYETAFEFNAVKMGGWNGIKVDMTLKPFSPYIHMMPNFRDDSLYGYNFEDARGLVSTCSYSLPQASEQWAEYQRTNSIYELSFNRDIQNLEFQQNVSRVKELIGIGAGGLGGAMATAQSPDPVSKAVGVASGVVMGTVNMAISEQMRKESMQYSLDKYNLNLKNIKAQPQTLTKVTALDINNRLFPVLEYYTCTDEEKLFFKDYLLYNSYRVERIGCIKDYVDYNADYTFIQADFIRLESVIGLDSHELGYISECLSAGWYFKPIEEV